MERPATQFQDEVFDDSISADLRVKDLQASNLGSRLQFSVYCQKATTCKFDFPI